MYDDVFGAPVDPLPKASPKTNFGDETPKNIQHDLWIVGSGTLGTLVAKKWMIKFPDARVCCETSSEKRHTELLAYGAKVSLRSNRKTSDEFSAINVLVCVPPGASGQAYIDEVQFGCMLWAGPLGGGRLVYTSSTAVYGESFGNIVNEEFRVDSRSSRAMTLINAENAVKVREGCVLRLSGLYTETRGPHAYWITNGTVNDSADGYINMLHYDDAAEACIAALCRGQQGSTYLVSDDAPLTRAEICDAALRSGLFPGKEMPKFKVQKGPMSKICDDSVTRAALGWRPVHTNFGHYMVNTLGGKPYELPRSDAPRPGPHVRHPLVEESTKSSAAPVKKSLLWLPGDDDDATF